MIRSRAARASPAHDWPSSFPAGNGRRRARTLIVELTVPFGCNLRDHSDEERLIGEKYLKRWGLVRDV